MNEKQIKEDIKEMKSLIKEAIKYLNGKVKWLEVTERKLGDWFYRLEDIDGVDCLSEDDMMNQVKDKLFKQTLLECYDFADITVTQLQDAIDEGEYEESHFNIVEYYEDKLELFETLRDKFDQDVMQYETIENAIEHLEEALDIL